MSQRSYIFASELSLVGLDITGMTPVKLRLFLAYARSCINAIGQSQVSAPNSMWYTLKMLGGTKAVSW